MLMQCLHSLHLQLHDASWLDSQLTHAFYSDTLYISSPCLFQQTEGYFLTRRLGIIKTLEGCLIGIDELKPIDHYLSQEVCVLMWNNMLPFFQPHLRLKVLYAMYDVMNGCYELM